MDKHGNAAALKYDRSRVSTELGPRLVERSTLHVPPVQACEESTPGDDPAVVDSLTRNDPEAKLVVDPEDGFDLATLSHVNEAVKNQEVAEQLRFLQQLNNTAADFPWDQCVHQLFEKQAALSAEATALVFEGAELTYAELNQRANRLAHYLTGLGVGPDSRVAICIERSFEMVIALFAVLKAGGAYVPLDPAYPVDRLRYMLEDSSPVALLTQSHLAGLFPSTSQTMQVLDLSTASAPWALHPETNPIIPLLQPQHLAYVIYTSGSTGAPKGVMIEHRSLVNRLVWMQQAYGLNSTDAVLQKTPFSFDVSVWEFFWPLLYGARLVMARPEGHKDPGYLVEAINQNKITTVHFVPSMLQVFLEHPDAASCTSLVRVMASGEALPPSAMRRFHQRLPQTELHNLYGPTEATVDVTAWACDWDPARTSIPIGKPIANTQIYILDEDGAPVTVGATGELYIGGIGVARGYLNRAALTTERFLSDPFSDDPRARMYRTGDLCRWLPDGNIEYLGRNDFQVKIRGFRIELGEIESRLAEHPEVREAVVVAREDVSGDKRLVAYVVLAPGANLRDRDLRDALGRKVPDYMVPSAFVLLAAMPVTVNGKLDRSALPSPTEANRLGVDLQTGAAQAVAEAGKQPADFMLAGEGADSSRLDNYVPPSDELEVELVQIWEEILGVKRIGIRDDFFKLGGHSLLAARMFARIGEKLHKNLPLAVMFHAPTIDKLAGVIRAEGWKPHWSVLVPIHESGDKPPLFLVHGLMGNVLSFYGLRHHIPADQPLYGVQAYGMDSGRASSVSIPEMATHYIREIRALQPYGPYYLGGFSAGGLVAYEMAQQLHAAGEQVQFLALFDSFVEAAGGYWLKMFYSKRAFRMALLSLNASLNMARRDGWPVMIRKKVRGMMGNMRILAWLLLNKVSGKSAGAGAQPAGFLKPNEAFLRAIRIYSPQPYPGSAVLFRTPSSYYQDSDPSDGWGSYVGGHLEVQAIRGGHDDIFRRAAHRGPRRSIDGCDGSRPPSASELSVALKPAAAKDSAGFWEP
ncbi:hypothetical protein ACPOL_5995 [Acidisarcina polymorpha]|uniref:Carrier domain-containing protein n=1 Tax=Acidisarcina polymorpha TaxID=2211140 RepID=A0A2Z5G8D2_9BACT|nr:amino acid adenylation domain-containing protein [Acidisarcina polymorpha]AXC15239.1 hypothetical protein ACPOL_5995 [Acidisarcina polymorpha]